MYRSKDLSGSTFGRLLVLHRVAKRRPGDARFMCLCSCGQHHEADAAQLRAGAEPSCGCAMRDHPKTHGLAKHPLYHCWYNMNDRCYDETNAQWTDYGGRGITVCDEWRGRHGLANFIADMGPCPKDHSIDRVDNNKPYSKTNCRWATRAEQQRNRRITRLLTYNGRTGTVSDWAKWLGLANETINYRLKQGRHLSVVLSAGRFETYGEKRKPTPLHEG